MDAVDLVMAQWQRERPDVDISPTGVVGRIQRLNRIIERELRDFFSAHDLGDNEFDVLATLRRAGQPYEMTAGAFVRASLVSSGTVTHRIDRMVDKGLVERTRPDDDRRVVRIRLSAHGLAVIDDMIELHMRNEARMLSALDDDERDGLAASLRALLVSFGDTTLT